MREEIFEVIKHIDDSITRHIDMLYPIMNETIEKLEELIRKYCIGVNFCIPYPRRASGRRRA